MHQGDHHDLILSATDLVRHLECAHLTDLERLAAAGVLEPPADDDPQLEVLRRRGHEHEAAELARLRAEGLDVVEIEAPSADDASFHAAEAATVAAMRAGADVVYQATFHDGRWRGRADFLRRVAGDTGLGPWGYEVADTKLARRPKPSALLQMASYSEHVARLQGVAPERMEVVTGDGARHGFPVAEVAAYHRGAKRRLEQAVAVPLGSAPSTYPHRVAHCGVCPWLPRCAERRRADDDLSLVAGMWPDLARRFRAAGVTTVSGLAAGPVGEPVPEVGQATADRLRRQARLQLAQRADGRVRFELLGGGEADLRLGLASLPEPSAGDLFFDIEGDPWVGDTGLEYLFGVVEGGARHGTTEPVHHAFWGHSREDEKRAFEQVVDLIIDRFSADPAMHVYHYAPYEVVALRTLSGRHATREAEVDRLLRSEVFVDLYRVVRSSVRISQDGYGLKKLEPLYLGERQGPIADGGASIVVYEEWLATGEPRLLEEIRAYNEVDCRSTLALRDWLEERRAELESAVGAPLPRPALRGARPPSGPAAEAESAATATAEALLAGVPRDPVGRTDEQAGSALLAGLVGYHRREAKPAWWWWFDRLATPAADLVDDHESIGDLRWISRVAGSDGADVHRYRFDPAQEHRMGVGARPFDPATRRPAGRVLAVDPVRGTIDLDRSGIDDGSDLHPAALVPEGPQSDGVLRDSLADLAAWVVSHGIGSARPEHRAARRFLLGRPPSIQGAEPGAPLLGPGEDPTEGVRRLAARLSGSFLAVQGPPGSGKTHTGAAVVVDAVARGRRVGVVATSHKAVSNLVSAAVERARDAGVVFPVVQKTRPGEGAEAEGVSSVTGNREVVAALDDGTAVAAGTAWLFARPELASRFDLLVVDEASQMPLANVVAIARAATDVVLLGDPRQLGQVRRGTHPPGVAASALEHVLGGHVTIPPDRGVFLHTSRRMHPDVGAVVSAVAYDGKLRSHPACGVQEVGPGSLVEGAGVRLLTVDHEGNRTRSPEEAAAVAAVVGALIGRPWTDASGSVRPLGLADILVIAPFNAHVAQLAEMLPQGARIGTVDRFQGQEAPVAIYSMAASSADDVPRGVDFLFSVNRLNVAVSRARALAVVVASPRLLEAPCRTAEQVRLVNALCVLAEAADGSVPPAIGPQLA